jgi:omega-hydroxy-beta-dihydromenaquinone-9 sulfotransferase
MIRVWWHSVGLYGRWWVGAFTARGRAAVPLGPRRWLWLLVVFPLFLVAQGVHWLGFLLDEIFFRGYRRVVLERPLIVTGIPRSGTTFVHRALAADTERFSTVRTWEAVLAPSVAERRAWRALAAIDRGLGGWGRRLVERLVEAGQGDFARIHAVGWDAPEEDYLCLLPAAGCFLAVLAFPGSAEAWKLGAFGRLEAGRRAELLGFYRACLRKHLYVEGRGRRLLSKNAAFGSWIPALAEGLPGARFLVCVREPVSALSSQLSAVAGACAAVGGAAGEASFKARFEDVFTVSLETVGAARAGGIPLAVVEQEALRADPAGVLRAALGELGERLSPAWEAALAEAAGASRETSEAHRHRPETYGLSRAQLNPSLQQAYATAREGGDGPPLARSMPPTTEPRP